MIAARLAVAFAATLLVACGATRTDLVHQAPGTVARSTQALGTIAGRPLDAADLLVELHGLLGADFLRVVDRLVATELARTEAGRLGVRVAPERLDAEAARVRDELLAAFAARRPGASYEELIVAELGLRPEVHAARLRDATLRQLTTERVVRATTLAATSSEVRLIVAGTRLEAEALRRRLEEGEDFAELANVASIDDSAEDGGRVPYLIDDERSPLSRAARLIEPGDVTGPFELGGHHVLLRLVDRREPLVGRWSEVAEAVEASLAADPVGESEFVHWQLAMESLYRVDLEPLADLLGLASDEPRERDELPSDGD